MNKTPEECKEYNSQVKRRRVLDFDNTADDISSSFLKSKVDSSIMSSDRFWKLLKYDCSLIVGFLLIFM